MITARNLFLKHVAQTSDAPLLLEIVNAQGVYLYDKDGKDYIDLIAGISVSNIGHCHPKVVEAIQTQAAKYMHLMVYGEYVYTPQVQLSKLLADHLPNHLNNVYLVNSGTEATEGALKLAKRFTGRTEMIGFKNSYHGSTHGALSLLGDEYFKQNYRPLLPDVRHIRYNNFDDLQHITTKTACVIAETVQAESGVNPPKEGFLQALRKRCTEQGALLILDEIQVGCGRTGTLFAFEQYGITPDILLLAKGLGGGMPIGAFIASKAMMEVFTDNPFLGHITTFGGNPVCAAAALASLQVLTTENHVASVETKAKLFKELLVHPAIRAVRNKGLLMALEFDSYEQNKAIIDRCIANGLITDWFLFAGNCLRIAPPLIITEIEIKKSCALLLQSIDEAIKH
ncbi:MAG: aspartate aminotransferase family protein [Chitinophagales bacterium]